jgi:large exoprotein involved in heme utilization and adhesion
VDDLGSRLVSDAWDSGHAGKIMVEADRVDILNGGILSSSTYFSGNAGSVTVNANAVTIDGQGQAFAAILSDAYSGSSGDAGMVTVEADTVNILDGGQVSSNALSSGNAGSIRVKASEITIDGKGNAALILSDTYAGSSGNAGAIEVEAERLNIFNGGQISSNTYSSGHAGSIGVKADEVTIDGQGDAALILTDAYSGSSGNAGSILMKAGTLNIINGGQVSSKTHSAGDAGNIHITGRAVTIDGTGAFAGILLDTFENTTGAGSGNAGTITLDAEELNIMQGGGISSSTYSVGNAGNVTVTAQRVVIDGKGIWTSISSEAQPESGGNAGAVYVETGSLDVRNEGAVSTSSGSKNAGDVTVKARTVTVDGEGQWAGIVSDANETASGNAGSVTVESGILDILNGGEVSSSTASATGFAGHVVVTAGRLSLSGGDGISSASWGENSSGRTGLVRITASDGVHLNQSRITIANDAIAADTVVATITPGTITVTAPDIDLKNSEITTHSSGNIAAGSIVVNFSHGLTMDPSFISTEANSGNGGSITINGGELIHLQNSGFRTSVAGGEGNGGNIEVKADMLVMETVSFRPMRPAATAATST